MTLATQGIAPSWNGLKAMHNWTEPMSSAETQSAETQSAETQMFDIKTTHRRH